MSERWIDRSAALAVFLASAAVYGLTMVPTVSLWDSAEFIASSYALGIAHAPGTPLYTLVGRLFSMLPLPIAVAARVNLLSALSAALSVSFIFLIALGTVRSMYPAPRNGREGWLLRAGPLAGALALAWSGGFWRDATEAEVYSASACLMGLATLLALSWYRGSAMGSGAADGGAPGGGAALGAPSHGPAGTRARAPVYLVFYLLAIGFAVHPGSLLVYGGIFLLFALARERGFTNGELVATTLGAAAIIASLVLRLPPAASVAGLLLFAAAAAWGARKRSSFVLATMGLILLGLSVNLYLYLRARLGPSMNEGDPSTLKALFAHLRREQYAALAIPRGAAHVAAALRRFWPHFFEQFRLWGAAGARPFDWGGALAALPVALGIAGIAANGARERRVWALNLSNLLLAFVATIIPVAFGLLPAFEVAERGYFYAPVIYFFAVFVGIGGTALLRFAANAAERGSARLASLPSALGALLVMLALVPAFAGWHEHDRSRNFITRDYAYNVLAGLERDAIFFSFGDNDTYPLRCVQIVEGVRSDVRVANLSLLGAPWYIRELRDTEPRAPIELGDAEIAALRPRALPGGGTVGTGSLVAQHIIEAAQWKRPIYFAVAMPEDLWRPYAANLELQGVVRRLVPARGEDMLSPFMIGRNFDDIFLFRGLVTPDGRADESVAKESDLGIVRSNYAVAMGKYVSAMGNRIAYGAGAGWLERAIAIDPSYRQGALVLGMYYLADGRPEKAVEHYRRLLAENPADAECWQRLAAVYQKEGRLSDALEAAEEGIRAAADSRQLYVDAFRYAAMLHDAARAKGYVSRWLARHPDDVQFRSLEENADRVLREQFGEGPGGAPPAEAAPR